MLIERSINSGVFLANTVTWLYVTWSVAHILAG